MHPKGQAILAAMENNMALQSPQEEDNLLGSGTSKMMEKMRIEMPLGNLLINFGGITDEQLDGILAMLNS